MPFARAASAPSCDPKKLTELHCGSASLTCASAVLCTSKPEAEPGITAATYFADWALPLVREGLDAS